MTRDVALQELQKPPYDSTLQQEDKSYVAKKLGFSETEFEEILSLPNRSHEEYGTDENQRNKLRNFMGWIRPATRILKSTGWRNDN